MSEELTKWQYFIVEKEKGLSNKQLFDEVIELAAGDDYDGAMTSQGQWEFDYLIEKLKERLGEWINE